MIGENIGLGGLEIVDSGGLALAACTHRMLLLLPSPLPLPLTQAYCGDCLFCKHPQSNLCTAGARFPQQLQGGMQA